VKAKQSKVKKSKREPGTKEATRLKLCQPDLMNISPLSNQFEPTDAQPIRRQSRMNGVCQ
jgi:hypothetical protein